MSIISQFYTKTLNDTAYGGFGIVLKPGYSVLSIPERSDKYKPVFLRFELSSSEDTGNKKRTSTKIRFRLPKYHEAFEVCN